MCIEKDIRNIYKDRMWGERVTNIIIEFVVNFQNTYGEKYINRIIERLKDLKEIREEYNDSKYIASSKRDYIIFYKKIDDDIEFKYILEHELFHFIQKEGSAFENCELLKNLSTTSNTTVTIFVSPLFPSPITVFEYS